MTDPTPAYWFHAKTSGWGWGLPARWEGWAAMTAWLAAVVAVASFLAGHHWVGFAAFMTAMAALVLGVCWWKGEPPRWR